MSGRAVLRDALNGRESRQQCPKDSLSKGVLTAIIVQACPESRVSTHVCFPTIAALATSSRAKQDDMWHYPLMVLCKPGSCT
jgi:hypothetical protein